MTAIDSYAGIKGVCFNIETPGEVYGVIDELHTQVMDNLPGRTDILDALEGSMRELETLGCVPD